MKRTLLYGVCLSSAFALTGCLEQASDLKIRSQLQSEALSVEVIPPYTPTPEVTPVSVPPSDGGGYVVDGTAQNFRVTRVFNITNSQASFEWEYQSSKDGPAINPGFRITLLNRDGQTPTYYSEAKTTNLGGSGIEQVSQNNSTGVRTFRYTHNWRASNDSMNPIKKYSAVIELFSREQIMAKPMGQKLEVYVLGSSYGTDMRWGGVTRKEAYINSQQVQFFNILEWKPATRVNDTSAESKLIEYRIYRSFDPNQKHFTSHFGTAKPDGDKKVGWMDSFAPPGPTYYYQVRLIMENKEGKRVEVIPLNSSTGEAASIKVGLK